jgi:hypothetical protein
MVGGLGALGVGGGALGALGGGALGFGGGVAPNPLDEESKKFQIAVVSLALDKQPFEEAIRQIRLQANINMVLDSTLGEKAKAPLTITLLNTPLDSATMVLTELADLDFVWLDNIFYVTSRDRAEKLKAKWPRRRSGGIAHPQDGGGAAAAGM